MSDYAIAVSQKTYLSSYITVALLGIMLGIAGFLVPPLILPAITAALILAAIALAKTEFALALLVLVAPLTNARVNIGPVPFDAVTICAALAILSYAIHNLGRESSAKAMPFTWAFILFLSSGAISIIIAPSYGSCRCRNRTVWALPVSFCS
ncbi:MAG: hypothetical protein HY779_04830 [Rubrobacteridae bacterium]|nr:hypothetical protein [Rubrobacteridae bacterium]